MDQRHGFRVRDMDSAQGERHGFCTGEKCYVHTERVPKNENSVGFLVINRSLMRCQQTKHCSIYEERMKNCHN